jgi:hypothetical protein
MLTCFYCGRSFQRLDSHIRVHSIQPRPLPLRRDPALDTNIFEDFRQRLRLRRWHPEAQCPPYTGWSDCPLDRRLPPC